MKIWTMARTVTIGAAIGLSTYAGYRLHGAQTALEPAPPVDSQQTALKPAPLADTSQLELILVQVFFRHGARTPLRVFKGIDENYDRSFHDRLVPHTQLPYHVVNADTGGPQPRSRMDERQLGVILKGGMSSGQLTTVGREQAYMLGKRLRKRYVEDLHFIDSLYNPSHVRVRSTNIKRCIESLRCVVSGIYGVQQFVENDTELKIPVKHMYHEDLYPNFSYCESLRHMQTLTRQAVTKEPQYVAAVGKVIEKLGNDPAYHDITIVRDAIVASKTHGIRVPQWLLEIENEVRAASVIGLFYHVTGDAQHKRTTLSLVSGRQYGMITNNMKAAMKDRKSVEKFHLYSCHDTTVYPLMLTLGLELDDWPPYSSDVRFELYQDRQNQHWVKVSYRGKEFSPPGFSGPLMSFADFHDLVEPVIISPERFKQACDDINVAREFARIAVPRDRRTVEEQAVPSMM